MLLMVGYKLAFFKWNRVGIFTEKKEIVFFPGKVSPRKIVFCLFMCERGYICG